jgi:hypothetical protein
MPLIIPSNSQSSTGFSIDQSIRYNDDDSPILKKTYSGAGTEETFTLSMWVKRGGIGAGLGASNLGLTLFSGGADVSNYGEIVFRSSGHSTQDCLEFYNSTSGSTNMMLKTNRLFRDPSAWYHLVFVMDTTNAVSSERLRMYINGVRETSFATATYPAKDTVPNFNTATEHGIGGFAVSTDTRFFDGYLAEIVFLDGTATDCNSFAEFNDSGIWIPKDVSGLTFGTNGFHIDGRDSADLGDDESGNGNDFTTSGLSSDDQVADSPTNNYGVFNVLEKDLRYSTTISNGNKTITFPSGSTGFSGTRLGLFRSNGKAYAEFKVNQAFSFSSGDGVAVFVCDDTQDPVSAGGGSSAKLEAAYTGVDGIIYDGASNQGTGTTWNTVNAVVGIYIDFDNGKGWFSKDGTVQTVNGTPNVETGANPHFTFTANSTLTVGAGGVHYATPAIVTLQNYAGEWATTPTSYTAFSTKAEGEA